MMMIITPHIWDTPPPQPPQGLRPSLVASSGRHFSSVMGGCLHTPSTPVWIGKIVAFIYFNNPYSIIRSNHPSVRLMRWGMRRVSQHVSPRWILMSASGGEAVVSGQLVHHPNSRLAVEAYFSRMFRRVISSETGWEERNSGNISGFSCDDINAIKY